MKDIREYRKNNTPVDWVIRDLMIEMNKLRSNLIYLYVVVILFIFLQVAVNVYGEPEEYSQFLPEVNYSDLHWGNDTSHLETNNHEREK